MVYSAFKKQLGKKFVLTGSITTNTAQIKHPIHHYIMATAVACSSISQIVTIKV